MAMWSLQLTLLTLLFQQDLTGAFNLEPRLPVVKQGDRGSYFGYSVAEHQVLDPNTGSISENVLLVGAPKAQTSQPGTNHSGAVYKCEINTIRKDCRQLQIDQDVQPPDEGILKDDQWLGVTVRSQGSGGYVMACAHRYILKGPDFQWGKGICYSLTQLLDLHRAWEPCMNRPVNKAHEQFGYCQAGTSGDISEDFNIVIGTPGPYTWRGTIFTNSVRYGMRDDKIWYMGPLLDENAPVDKYSYLGMSVTSGKFFKNQVSFVGGAPRANGTGQVVFFTKEKGDSTFFVQLVLDGEQFASSYGYSLASLDINSDGLIDLVVGAPFYFEREDGGAIYVYLNTKSGFQETTEPTKITGKPESRFGFAIANAGDLNSDSYPDLAVGAPYEESGTVYIYLGSANGIISEPAQVIRVNDLAKEALARTKLSTFGYSLAGGMDLDGNGYPDLLVGAYEADAVVLLRSRPIIDIMTSVRGKLTNVDPNAQGCPEDRSAPLVCFSFEACFRFNSSVVAHTAGIRLNYRIEAETFGGKKYYRVKFNSSLNADKPNLVEKEIVVRGEFLVTEHCSRELVYLKDKSDILNPIPFKLTYSLVQKEPKMASEGDDLPDINRYPILNQQEASKVFEVKFLKHCGPDDICESDLHVEADLNLPKEDRDVPVLYLGEDHLNLSVKVINRGEPAYDATMYIMHPPSLSFVARKVLKGDQIECLPLLHNSSILKCELGNPLKKTEVELQIRFNPRKVTDGETSLKFTIKVNTTSEEKTPEPDLELIADVARIAELELRGGSKPDQVFYQGPLLGQSAITYLEDIGSLVEHKYEVINHGRWIARDVEVVVRWPYEVENNRAHGKWLLYLVAEPTVQGDGYCKVDSGVINPLRLKSKPQENATTEAPSLPEPGATTRSQRRKREMVIVPEELRMEGKTVKVVTMDCIRRTAKCLEFKCFIKSLQSDKSAVITIPSRLWQSTFVEDYAAMDWVLILSRARLRLDPSSGIKQLNLNNDFDHAETKALPGTDLYQKPEGAPLWIIILSVCAGIVLLVILVLILWRIGFFKRKKPGYVLASTNDKEKEANNL